MFSDDKGIHMHSGDDLQDQALYRALVSQASDAIIYADAQGLIRVWNAGAARLFGYGSDEALGKSLDLIIPERFREAHWKGYERAMQSGATKYAGRLMTTRSAHKDGRKLYVEMAFDMIRDGSGAVVGALAVARDCTERQMAQRQ
jgi:PAS domain S-box-containing protein